MTNNKEKPIISLCIPTNGVLEWILPVLRSIYTQNVDLNLFEVVITDNGVDSKLKTKLSEFNYSNLHFYESAEKGFVNQISSFKNANGIFCKMLNHRGCLLPGSLQKMIEVVRKYQDIKPILYFSDAKLKSYGEFIECSNIDAFVYSLHYWISWSSGIGIWDIDKSQIDNINYDRMFPHASLIFGSRQNSSCVIWNKQYQKMLDDSGKGGYDVFYTFSVTLLDLLKELKIQKRISRNTLKYTKRKLLNFLSELYYTEVLRPRIHTFEIKDIKKSILVHYTIYDYYWMIFRALFFFVTAPVRVVKRCMNKRLDK